MNRKVILFMKNGVALYCLVLSVLRITDAISYRSKTSLLLGGQIVVSLYHADKGGFAPLQCWSLD